MSNKVPKDAAELHVGQIAALVDGATVSVDVSTGDHDHQARVFARVYSAQREGDGSLTLLAELTEDTRPKPTLAEVLAREFTQAELHGFIIAAYRPDNRGAAHWEKLRRAAIEATDRDECRGGAR